MSSILNITLPIFLLIGLGYGLVRGGMFTREHMRALGQIVVNVALPAVIIRALSKSSVAEVFNVTAARAKSGPNWRLCSVIFLSVRDGSTATA